MKSRCYTEIESIEEFRELALRQSHFDHFAFQDICFIDEPKASEYLFTDSLFIGCRLSDQMQKGLGEGCIIFPKLDLPYNTFPSKLYNAESLYSGYDHSADSGFEQCYDTRVYRHYLAMGKSAKDIHETLARSLHDHSISDALNDFLESYDPKRVVAIMGGHAMLRSDSDFLKIAQTSKRLTELGFLVCSGGGPGAMEAVHLGAWMASRSDMELTEAVERLSPHPDFKSEGWLRSAFKVMEQYPRIGDYHSLAIPTWFYGHEPATPFATHIAKYFDNSIREDGLLAIAKGGVIYTPGSAGTMQEIFQDAAQNHYLTYGLSSPMIFLGSHYWQEIIPVYTLLKKLQESDRYRNLLLSITDDKQSAIESLLEFSRSK